MGKVFIQARNKRTEIEEKDLIERIEKTLLTLENFIEHNLVNSKIPGVALYRTRVSIDFMADILLTVPPLDSTSPEYTFTLKEIVYNAKFIVNDLRDGRAVPNKIELPFDMESNGSSHYCVTMARIMDAVSCESCEGIYTRSGLSAHIGSLRCMRDAQVLDVSVLGYEIVDDPGAVAAIRKAGLDFKVRPSALDMWVPPWVCKAVRDYRKDSKGYAGMKLHEFLKAVHGAKNNG